MPEPLKVRSTESLQRIAREFGGQREEKADPVVLAIQQLERSVVAKLQELIDAIKG